MANYSLERKETQMSDGKRHEITGDAETGTQTNAETVAAEAAKENPGSSDNTGGSNDDNKAESNPQAEKPKDGGGLTHK